MSALRGVVTDPRGLDRDHPRAVERARAAPGGHVIVALLAFSGLRGQLRSGDIVVVDNVSRGVSYRTRHELTARQIGAVVDGGMIRHTRLALGRGCG